MFDNVFKTETNSEESNRSLRSSYNSSLPNISDLQRKERRFSYNPSVPTLLRNPPLVHLGQISESGRSRIWGILGPDFGRFSGLKRSKHCVLNAFWAFYKVKYQNYRLRRYNKGVLPCVARRRREKIAILEPLKRDFTRENGPKMVDFWSILWD